LIPFDDWRRVEALFVASLAIRRLLWSLIRAARIDLVGALVRMIMATLGRRITRWRLTLPG